MSFNELSQLDVVSIEEITVESHPSTISIHVQPTEDRGIRVIVQGFMKARFVPGSHVALDGFRMHPDGRITAMEEGELNQFG
jgi:hypothetical protein